MAELLRPAWVEVDRDALIDNARSIAAAIAPAQLCAVVKANAYGHGAAEAASAFVRAGAPLLAVALVEEGIELRDAGIDAEILLLSEPTRAALAEAIAYRLTPTIYTHDGLATVCALASAARPVAVHLKLDSGMHRVGTDASTVVELARVISVTKHCHLGGLWTHFAVADEPDNPFTKQQLEALLVVADTLRRAGIDPGLLHAANSAGALSLEPARLDLARVGIALYGYEPSPGFLESLSHTVALRPALSLKARVHLVRTLEAGERTSYGRRYATTERSDIATIPLGYHDGVSRRLAECGAEVLINGVRRPFAGTVTMDQLLVDCGPRSDVRPGDEVVLIGRQGDHEIEAADWARRLSTIVYEILCGIGARVPRVHVGG